MIRNKEEFVVITKWTNLKKESVSFDGSLFIYFQEYVLHTQTKLKNHNNCTVYIVNVVHI